MTTVRNVCFLARKTLTLVLLVALLLPAVALDTGCRRGDAAPDDTGGVEGTPEPGGATGGDASANSAYVTVGVARLQQTGLGVHGIAGPEQGPLADGATAVASFEDVVADIFVAGEVSEETMRLGVTSEPAGASYKYLDDWQGGSILQVRWPGVAFEAGKPFPDPAEVVRTGQAPPGFALEMKLTVNAAILPAFSAQAGEDGLLEVTVLRRAALDYTVSSRDHFPGRADDFVLVPYPGYRDIYHVTPEPHTLELAFSKPMDRESVERTLVQSGRDDIDWNFSWTNDQTLRVVVSPAAGLSLPVESRIYPDGAIDQEGVPLWFSEPLVLRWVRPTEVAVRTVGDQEVETALFQPGEAVGIVPVDCSPSRGEADGDAIIFVEPGRTPDEDSGPLKLLWLGVRGADTRLECFNELEPFSDACWLDKDNIFLSAGNRWEVFRPFESDSGTRSTKVNLSSSGFVWVGFYPSPRGDRVAAFRKSCEGTVDGQRAVDLVVFDLEGRERQVLASVTLADDDDYMLERIPAAWLPSEDGLVFVDRLADGTTGISWVNLADGAITAVPGTGGVERSQDKAFAVFASPSANPGETVTCVCGEFRGSDGRGEYRVVELEAGRVLVSGELGQQSLPRWVFASIPSRDGRHLAISGQTEEPGERGTLVLSFYREAMHGWVSKTSVFEAMAFDWSPDGTHLYVYRTGE